MTVQTVHDRLFDLEPQALRCPHETWHRIRREAPVCCVDRLGSFVVTKYDDILAVLRAPEVFSSARASGPGSATPLAERVAQDPNETEEVRRLAQRRVDIARSVVLLKADPPIHNRQRRLVNSAFRPSRVRASEPAVRGLADDYVDGFG